MSYTEDAVKAKLASLNDQQESIVTVAQWIMFHRRFTERTAQLWLERIRDASSSRRLALIYLANEICQQAKARKKEEFTKAWTPLITEATSLAYKGATLDVQGKIKRVVAVWRDRQIFELSVQAEIESSIDQIDQARGSGKKTTLGGTLSSSSQPSVAPELQPLIKDHGALTRAESSSAYAKTAIGEDDKLSTSDIEKLTLPVQANRLGALLKALANADGAVVERARTRKSVLQDLEKLLEDHRAKLMEDEKLLADLTSRKRKRQDQKARVEQEIIQSMSTESEPQRPEDEPLTPPAVESLTPVGSPKVSFVTSTAVEVPPQLPAEQANPVPLSSVLGPKAVDEALQHVPVARSPVNGEGPQHKKRKFSAPSINDEEAAFDPKMMGDLDEDVSAMLDGK